MAMSRKHYREAADIISEAIAHCVTWEEAYAISTVAQGLARMYKRDNSDFRYDRFYAACGLDPFGNVTAAKSDL